MELLGDDLGVVDAFDRPYVVGGRAPTLDADDRARLRATGAHAAESGTPLHELIDTHLGAELRIPPTAPGVAPPVAPSYVVRLVRDVDVALTEGYESAHRSAIRREEETRHAFIDELLRGPAVAGRAEGPAWPRYLAQDPLLVRVIDEPHADRLCVAPRDRLVADCLRSGRPRQFSVAHDCTVLEVAELMARTGCPVVAVQERSTHGASRYVGAVTATRLLEHLQQGTHA